jgi:hypothetical protein
MVYLWGEPSYVIDFSYDSRNLNKVTSAPRHRSASDRPAVPLQKFSSYQWGHAHIPSPYGQRHCMLVIDHHTNYMWFTFLKTNNDTCAQREYFCWTRGTSMRSNANIMPCVSHITVHSPRSSNSTRTYLSVNRLGLGSYAPGWALAHNVQLPMHTTC